jgi:hypothetical protein
MVAGVGITTVTETDLATDGDDGEVNWAALTI